MPTTRCQPILTSKTPLADRHESPDSAPASLIVRGVDKAFDGQPAVDGVRLDVPAGSTVALLGPSGCGKTTLLRCIAGLERCDAGEVWIGDTQVAGSGLHVPPERRNVGMVFQDWALFPHVSVARNIGFGLTRPERRSGVVGELLELVGLAGLDDRSPGTLSGGQQQRVALARALAHGPSIILLDEPFSNLDSALRSQVRLDVRELMRDLGITALFVTHDQEEAFELGDEVAVMFEGLIEQQAPPAELYHDPATQAIADFIGDANMLAGAATGSVADTQIGPVPLCRQLEGPVDVLVRPEQLELGHGCDGVIQDVEFYGHDAVYRVRLACGLELGVRVLASPELGIGEQVAVSYNGRPAPCFASSPASNGHDGARASLATELQPRAARHVSSG